MRTDEFSTLSRSGRRRGLGPWAGSFVAMLVAGVLFGSGAAVARQDTDPSTASATAPEAPADATPAEIAPAEIAPAEIAPAESSEDGGRPRLLVLELTGDGAAETERRTLTTLIGIEVASRTDFDVVTSQELEKLLTVEQDRQLLGCLDASCLAEVAGAMGTERIVFGEIAKLGTSIILTVSLFDAFAARATERVVVRSDSIDGIVEQIGPAVTTLTASIAKAGPEAGLTALTATSGAETTAASKVPPKSIASAAESDGPSWLAIGGWSMFGVGLVVGAP